MVPGAGDGCAFESLSLRGQGLPGRASEGRGPGSALNPR